jgi:hypothetical protein
MDYLNRHPFILKRRKEKLFYLNKKRNELLYKMDQVDSVISKDQSKNQLSNSNQIYFSNEETPLVYQLIKYKDELMDDLSELEINLEKAKNSEIFILDGFNSPEIVENNDFYSIRYYVKYFIFSVLIVMIVSFFLNRILVKK